MSMVVITKFYVLLNLLKIAKKLIARLMVDHLDGKLNIKMWEFIPSEK